MLILTSNGLSQESLIKEVEKYILPKMRKAAIITTASIGYKDKDWHIPRFTNELNSLGLHAECFDFDTQPAEKLHEYDAIEIIGGNPFYLLKQMKKTNCKPLFAELNKDKIIIGISAGSVVLQKSISLIAQYSPELNENVMLNDLTGLCLTDVEILPHYSKFLTKFQNFEERATQYEKKYNCKVIRLNDGQGVFVSKNMTYLV